MNADGTNPVTVTSTGPLPNTSTSSDPTWSPDGTRLAFVSDRGGRGRSEIWVVNVDGSGLVKLTTNIQLAPDPLYGLDVGPSWSPDGSRIAFASGRDSLSNYELYVMNADGSNQTRLTNNTTDDYYPTWSPDSQRITFFRNDNTGTNGRAVYIMNRDGGNKISIMNDAVYPSWSPVDFHGCHPF